MRPIPEILLVLTLALCAAPPAYPTAAEAAGETETLAFRNLRRIVEEEERILEHARDGEGDYDVNRVRQGFQELVRKYEVFLGENPDYAPGYVAYGLMLDRAGETGVASRMFLRANQLDPNIPVVKNQLGNYMVEEERPEQALGYFLAAIELEPEEPLYHLQLGNLLAEYRQGFLDDGIYDAETLDTSMQDAFREAARLGEDEIAYAYRYAESFYDVGTPDWDEALAVWSELGERLSPGVERQTVRLQQANIHLLRGEPQRAERLLEEVTAPVLQGNRERLEARLE